MNNDSISLLTEQVLDRVQAFREDLKAMGVDQVFLRSNYTNYMGVQKGRKVFNGRTIISRKDHGLDLIFTVKNTDEVK